MLCDLRSDVLAPLSAEVLEAFNRATQRPPAFGRREDADCQALCAEAAGLFGFEDALFVSTGTLANQIAVRLWVQPGESIIADRGSHLATNEAASAAGLNSAVLRLIDGDLGHPSATQIAALLSERGGSAADRRVRLVWIENTHNRAGGTILPPTEWQAIVDLAASRQLALHVDGARIFNALAATGERPDRICRGASSAMVAANKIAGAPLGALLLGDRAFIEEAERIQKMFGGLWRPVGPLAAAAGAALRQWPERARVSHDLAAHFAKRLSLPRPQTNIVMLQLESEAEVDRVLAFLADTPVRVSPYRDARIRCVFHPAITHELADMAADLIVRATSGG